MTQVGGEHNIQIEFRPQAAQPSQRSAYFLLNQKEIRHRDSQPRSVHVCFPLDSSDKESDEVFYSKDDFVEDFEETTGQQGQDNEVKVTNQAIYRLVFNLLIFGSRNDKN